MKKKIGGFFLLFVFLAGCSLTNAKTTPTPPPLGDTPFKAVAPAAAPLLYGRGLLSPKEADSYDQMVNGLAQRPLIERVPLSSSLSPPEMDRIRQLVYFDHPEFYWADFSLQVAEPHYELLILPKDGQPLKLVDQQLAALEAKAIEALRPTQGLTDYEKLLYIHDYLATTVIYDYGFKVEYSGTAYGALIDGVGYCDGFARGFQYLAHKAGLTQVYVQGWDLKGTAHAWNGVKTPYGWLYTDTTWDRFSNDYGGAYHNFAAMSLPQSLKEREWDRSQYPALPSSLEEGHSYYFYKNYIVDLNTTPQLSDSIPTLVDVIQRQLEDHQHLSPQYEYAFLELEVVGSPTAYHHWKRQFMQDVFTVLDHTQQALAKESSPLSILVDSTVSCHFNDSMQIVSFYPKIKKSPNK